MNRVHVILIVISGILLIVASILLFVLFSTKSSPQDIIAGASGVKSVYQVDFNRYFCVHFFSLQTRIANTNTSSSDKYTRTNRNIMCRLQTNDSGQLFTFLRNNNTDNVETDVDLVATNSEQTVTNRSLQEICGGTAAKFTFIPYFSTIYSDVMIATDKQINAKLSSLAFESKAMETSPTQNNGAFYIQTDDTGKFISLNLGKIENGLLVPIASKDFGFNINEYPNTAFILADPSYNITQIISTSAYNTIFGPYACPTFKQSVPAATVTASPSSLQSSFKFNIPALFCLNIFNELNPTTGQITILKNSQIPVSLLTPYLKSGVSVMSTNTATTIFGGNLDIPLDQTISKTGVHDAHQSYGFLCEVPLTSKLIYCVYDNTAKKFTLYDIPKLVTLVMLTGTSLTQSAAGDVVNLSILGRTYSSVDIQPVAVPSPPILPLLNPASTPEEYQQQTQYEQQATKKDPPTQERKKTLYEENKLTIFALVGIAVTLVILAFVFFRFWKKSPPKPAASAPPIPAAAPAAAPTAAQPPAAVSVPVSPPPPPPPPAAVPAPPPPPPPAVSPAPATVPKPPAPKITPAPLKPAASASAAPAPKVSSAPPAPKVSSAPPAQAQKIAQKPAAL